MFGSAYLEKYALSSGQQDSHTEPQNGLGWKGLQKVTQPNPLSSKQEYPQLDQSLGPGLEVPTYKNNTSQLGQLPGYYGIYHRWCDSQVFPEALSGSVLVQPNTSFWCPSSPLCL